MADTGYNSTSANEAWSGDPTTFTNPNNGHATDDAYATVAPANNSRYSRVYYGFGLDTDIPDGATITGVQVGVEHKATALFNSDDSDIQLLKTSRGVSNGGKTFVSQTSETYYIYGASDDLWGGTWTKSDFTDANFAVLFRIRDSGEAGSTWSLDHVIVKVHYSTTTAYSLTASTGYFTHTGQAATFGKTSNPSAVDMTNVNKSSVSWSNVDKS